MKYLKTYESFNYLSNDTELLEEGWKEWFLGAAMVLSSLVATGQEPEGEIYVPNSKTKIEINASSTNKDQKAQDIIKILKGKIKEVPTSKELGKWGSIKYSDGSEIAHHIEPYSGAESIMLVNGNQSLSVMKNSDGNYQVLVFNGNDASQVTTVNGAEVLSMFAPLFK